MNFPPFARTVLILFVLALTGQALPGRLQAQVTVEVVNQSEAQAYICFSYHDIISDSRVTRGWWPIGPRAAIDIRVNTRQPDLSWYAYNTKGLTWGGRKNEPETEQRHVVLENFLVKEGWKPRGKKHLMVDMKKEKADDNRLKLILPPLRADVGGI